MKVFDYKDARQVIVCGDIHGDFRGLVYKLCIQYGCTDTLLIVAGDCGFGFYKPAFYETSYNQVAGRLKKANNWVVFVRGNHDDPSYFAEEKIHYARWRCVPDYSVIRTAGHSILCVGGAVSIDRKMRKRQNVDRLALFGHTETASWWADEAPVFKQEEINAIPEDILIDAVVTHTSPSYCELLTKDGLRDWLIYDPGLKWDVPQERETMDKLAEALQSQPVKEWFYGHFHRTWSGVRHGIRYSMLDILEFRTLSGE